MIRAVVLALLVVLPLVAGSGAADVAAPSQLAATDDVGILVLDGQSRAGFATQRLDVGTAVAAEREVAAAQLRWHTLDEQFTASNDQARRELLFQAATAVEIRSSALHVEEQALWATYVNGSISTDRLVRELVLLDTRTAILGASLGRIGEYADRVPGISLQARLRTLEANLVGSSGPVRDHAAAAASGDALAARLYVEVSPGGIVLATIDNSEYIREAYRVDQRSDSSGVFGLDEAVSRTAEVYPVAYNENTSLQTGISGLGGGLYRINIEFREGALTAFLDGTTRNVFYEIQERDLDLLMPSASVETVENGTRLVVNRSYAGGPLRVAVYDQETGDPIETTVVVADTRLETDSRGVVWTLAPTDRTNISTVGLGDEASITVFPLSPPVVNNSAQPGG